MRTLKLFISVAIIVFIASSCATHWGMMSGNASLASNNFKMIKIASGSSTATKVFGLGGLGKDALVLDAKKNLMENNPLKDGQALANVTVDFKNSIIFFVMIEKVTVTADIVEFK
jgi:Family of unknown function (DUF6567)